MTLTEAWDAEVSRAAAIREVVRHGASVAEFLADCGDLPEYVGGDVLAWLGY